MIENYYSAGELIRAKLEADYITASSQSPTPLVVCKALRAAGWQYVRQYGPQLAPVVFVWHQLDRIPGDRKTRGFVQQIWNTVLVIKNVETPTGAGAERDADPYVSVLLQLENQQFGNYQALIRAQSEFRTVYADGCGYYPFAWAEGLLTFD